MSYFPFMIEVKGHKALVVGAGRSAQDKIRDLTEFGADVTVVAPVISADVVKQGKNITIERRVYRPGETKGYEIVVAATDNPAVNKQVAHDAARFGAICTVADDPYRGGFVFPAIIKKDNYSVAICADGSDSELEKKIKEKIAGGIPEKADEIVMQFADAREEMEEPSKAAAGNVRRLADIQAPAEDEGEPEEEEIRYEEDGVVKVGAAPSRLDQVQADNVISMLSARGVECEKVTIREGESESQLALGAADLVVRPAESLPVDLPEGAAIAACLPREDARDILVTRRGTDKNDIDVIATSSEVRRVQIERFLKLGRVESIEGSIPDRIRKLKDGECDALILTSCEVKRLMLISDEELSFEFIAIDKSLPAPGQGVTVIESRESGRARDEAAKLNDEHAMTALLAERHFLSVIGASENDEAAAYSIINGGRILMKVMKYVGGKCVYFAGSTEEGDGLKLAETLGEKVNRELREEEL